MPLVAPCCNTTQHRENRDQEMCPVSTDVLQQHFDRLVQTAQAPAGLLLHYLCHNLWPDPDYSVQEPRRRRLLGLPARRIYRFLPGRGRSNQKPPVQWFPRSTARRPESMPLGRINCRIVKLVVVVHIKSCTTEKIMIHLFGPTKARQCPKQNSSRVSVCSVARVCMQWETLSLVRRFVPVLLQ